MIFLCLLHLLIIKSIDEGRHRVSHGGRVLTNRRNAQGRDAANHEVNNNQTVKAGDHADNYSNYPGFEQKDEEKVALSRASS